MKKYTTAVFLISAIAISSAGQSAQQASSDRARVIGEITSVDLSAGRVTIKSDSGNVASILINGDTTVLSVPPGEPSLANSRKISINDLHPGDRAYARYGKAQMVGSRPRASWSSCRPHT